MKDKFLKPKPSSDFDDREIEGDDENLFNSDESQSQNTNSDSKFYNQKSVKRCEKQRID